MTLADELLRGKKLRPRAPTGKDRGYVEERLVEIRAAKRSKRNP
jgi:hypothetical protein